MPWAEPARAVVAVAWVAATEAEAETAPAALAEQVLAVGGPLTREEPWLEVDRAVAGVVRIQVAQAAVATAAEAVVLVAAATGAAAEAFPGLAGPPDRTVAQVVRAESHRRVV